MEIKINPGDKVYFVAKPMYLSDKADTEGIVHLTFLGDDGYIRVVVKHGANYELLHINRISTERNGETGYDRIIKDPKMAFDIAVELGVYNTDRTLTIRYGGEYDLIDGVKFYDDDTQ